ncbi:hypothetical protein [Brevibacterium sp. FME17]|nr:hypothetical protein [Brevibacterium sp. FME17]
MIPQVDTFDEFGKWIALNAGFRIFNLVWADLFRVRGFKRIKAVLDELT